MPIYTWKNQETGELVDVVRPMSQCYLGPDKPGVWERVYAFGVGRVEGGGGSPARPSVKRET